MRFQEQIFPFFALLRASEVVNRTPSSPIALEQSDLVLACGGARRFACRSNLPSEATRFVMPPAEANAIIDETVNAVSSS